MKKKLSFLTVAFLALVAVTAFAVEGEGTAITWDFSEFPKTADEYKEDASNVDGYDYNGLICHMPYAETTKEGVTSATDYITTGGFHANGTSNAKIRFMTYTPTVDGILTVTYRSNNKTATDRITAIGTEIATFTKTNVDEGSVPASVVAHGFTTGSTPTEISAELTAGTTYYIYLANGGQTITKVQYVETSATEVTEDPQISVTEDDASVVVSAIGEGSVILYANGTEVENPYTVARTNEDQVITFTATAQEDGKEISSTVTQEITVTKLTTEPAEEGDVFKKVTSTANITDGEYLIVYEDGSVAFNGSLETLDAVENTVSVTIKDDEIKANEDISKATFTINTTDGTLLSSSGYYVGVLSNNNGLKQSKSTYTNSFAIDDEGNAEIKAVFDASTMALRFNAAKDQMRFRYYKNNGGNQKVIALYKKVVELEVPGTEIWSNEEAQDVDWNQGKAVMVDAEKFADVKVGDRLNIGILGAPEDAAPGNWAYQVALQDGDNWKNLEGGEPLKQAGDYVHSFIITGDMLRYMKKDGLAINGTKFQVKKVAVESAFEGTDESIWVGEQTGNVQINICHFANAADFAGVKVGDIIRVTIDSPNWIGLNYNTPDPDYAWSNFTDEDFKVENNWSDPVVSFTIKTENAVNILNKENGGIFVNNPNVTVKQVEIIPAPTYAVTISESENGLIEADKTEALEGETVTLTPAPENGYALETLTVKDADGADVEVSDNSFTMPASDVTITATFAKAPVDVDITVESGNDIYAAVTEAAGGSPVKSITVTLENDGEYTISKTLTSQGNVTINGAEGATIDASSLSAPLITLNGATANFAPKADGTDSDHFLVESVTIKDVTIKGLKDALVKDAQKSLVETVTIENSVVEMPASGKNVLDFNGMGYAGKVIVKNSTIWSAGKNTGFFAQYGSRPKNVNGDLLQEFDVQNSTIVNIANGKNFCDLKQNGTAQNVYTIKNSIFADCGKAGQVVVGFNKGQTSATPVWDVDGNTFIVNGADNSEAEISKAGQKSGEDIVKNSLTSNPGFADAASGDFTLDFASEQYAQKTGDPRWLSADPTVMVAPESGDFAAIVAQAVKEGKETLALPAGAAYKAGSTVYVDKKLNIIGDESDPATLELGMKGFVIKDALDMENMIIDAATNAEPFIALSAEPNEELLGANNGSDYYNIMDPVILRNLTITGVKGKLIYDNNKKYALDNLLIENCIVQLRTPKDKKETVIYMQGGGIRMLEVNTSTFYQKGQGDNDYFVRYNNSARLDRMGYNKDMEAEDFVPEGFIYESNTFYKVAYEGQWGNYSGFNGQKYTAFTVNKNIWVDCGSGQIARRMLGSRGAEFYEVCEFDQNTYIYNGTAETEGTMKNGEPVGTYDLSGTAITKVPTFKQVATGDFTLDANDVQNKQQTGDPRWFAEEEATGIVNVNDNANLNDNQNAPAYNLAGQRVNAQTAKGIIIKNGRKYVK